MSDEQKEIKFRIVYPGDVVYEGMDMVPGYGTYRKGEKIISQYIGIVNEKGTIINVTPLDGPYIPKVGDYVIGEITDVGASFWVLDIHSPYDAYLGVYDIKEFVEKNTDISEIYDVGDIFYAKVTRVTKSKYVAITLKDPQAKKLEGGMILDVTPSKVPRIIGKGGSMIKLIKDKTQTKIIVGQNGRIWLSGKHVDIAVEAILFVERFSIMQGLTDKVSEFLDKKLKEIEE